MPRAAHAIAQARKLEPKGRDTRSHFPPDGSLWNWMTRGREGKKKKAPVKHKGQTGREMFKMAKKDGGRGRGRCCQYQHFWEELECVWGGGGQGKGHETGWGSACWRRLTWRLQFSARAIKPDVAIERKAETLTPIVTFLRAYLSQGREVRLTGEIFQTARWERFPSEQSHKHTRRLSHSVSHIHCISLATPASPCLDGMSRSWQGNIGHVTFTKVLFQKNIISSVFLFV